MKVNDTYVKVLKLVKDKSLSIRQTVIELVEIECQLIGGSKINKERYMKCYNVFNEKYGVDVYFETKEYNAEIDRWIIREKGYNKNRKESYKKCIRDYIIYKLEMGEQLLEIVCIVFEKEALDFIDKMNNKYVSTYDETLEDEEW